MNPPNTPTPRPAHSPSLRSGCFLTVCACLAMAAAADPALGVGGIFAECKIVDHLADRPVVMLDAGRAQGIELGDQSVLITDGRMVAVGRVFYLEPSLCAVRMGWRSPAAAQAQTAVVVSQTLPNSCRVVLPTGTTISSHVDQVAPGHRTAWLDQGRNAGLLLGDHLLVDQAGVPVALADVVEVYEDQALVRVQGFSSDVPVRRGDRASLWPNPGEVRAGLGRLPVIGVASRGTGQVIWLPGGVAQGLLRDRSVEAFRAGAYLGTAVIDEPGLVLTRATTVEVYARRPIEAGDRVAVRLMGGGAEPSGRVFRIDGSYCLVSMGEDVGIRRRRQLHVARAGNVVAKLVVKTVKETYCGAEIVASGGSSGGASAIQLWDQVVSDPPDVHSVNLVGKITEVTPDGGFASVGGAISGEIGKGTLVSISWRHKTIGAALIIHKVRSGIILHLPLCWRGQDVPVGAGVFYSRDTSKSDE